MAYLELSLVAYDNLIKAAGNRGGQVSKVCREQGTWEDAAAAEAPPGAVKDLIQTGPGEYEDIQTAVDVESEPVQTDLDIPPTETETAEE